MKHNDIFDCVVIGACIVAGVWMWLSDMGITTIILP